MFVHARVTSFENSAGSLLFYVSFCTLTSNSSLIYRVYHPTVYSSDIEEASLNNLLKEEIKQYMNITASRIVVVGGALEFLLAQNSKII
jgi:hypothetical protein